MRISARADYAVRAVVELAAAGEGGPVKAERQRPGTFRAGPAIAAPAKAASAPGR